MNVDEAMEIATSTAITLSKLEMAEVSEVIAAEVERLRAELAAAKAASELPVQVIDCYSFGDDVEVVCKCGDDADRLSGWLRDRMKDKTPPQT